MNQLRTAEWFHDEFLQLARKLDDAIKQEKKPRHLAIRKYRLEILAARIVVRAVNAGHFDAYPKLRQHLRLAWTGQLSGGKGTITIDPNGKKHIDVEMDVAPDDGKPLSIAECTDERLARLWIFPIVQLLQTIQPDRFEGLAGKFNFKTIRTDDAGRPVGTDGEPLRMVTTEIIDPKTGLKHVSGKLNGEFAYVGDDDDELDAMARERFRVVDSASACLTLADLLPVDSPNADTPAPARYSPDFRSVHWYGTDYEFTATQAAVVKTLWESWEKGTPVVGDATLLTDAGATGDRLRDFFRNCPAWGTMIVDGGTKGSSRLNAPTGN